MCIFAPCPKRDALQIMLHVRDFSDESKTSSSTTEIGRIVTIEEFTQELNEYLHWYNEKRIKKSLGYLSPVEYRRTLGLTAEVVQENVHTTDCEKSL
jgi:transposase InsO family protein